MSGSSKKNQEEKLRQEYGSLIGKAIEAQRAGDIRLCPARSGQAEKICLQIESAED